MELYKSSFHKLYLLTIRHTVTTDMIYVEPNVHLLLFNNLHSYIQNRANSWIRTNDLLLTKRLHYHCTMLAKSGLPINILFIDFSKGIYPLTRHAHDALTPFIAKSNFDLEKTCYFMLHKLYHIIYCGDARFRSSFAKNEQSA